MRKCRLVKKLWCQQLAAHSIVRLAYKNFEQVNSTKIKTVAALMRLLRITVELKCKLRRRGGWYHMRHTQARQQLTFNHVVSERWHRADAMDALKKGLSEQIYRRSILLLFQETVRLVRSVQVQSRTILAVRYAKVDILNTYWDKIINQIGTLNLEFKNQKVYELLKQLF